MLVDNALKTTRSVFSPNYMIYKLVQLAGHPISIADFDTLFCFMNEIKPAHTVLLLELSGAAFGKGFSSAFEGDE